MFMKNDKDADIAPVDQFPADPEIVDILVLTLSTGMELLQIRGKTCRISVTDQMIPQRFEKIVPVERSEDPDRNRSFVPAARFQPAPEFPGNIHTSGFSLSAIIPPVKFI
jgi:hypothetical protein